MEGFVCSLEVFVLNPVLYREPVQMDEDGGDVVRGFGAGDDPGSRVWSLLRSLMGRPERTALQHRFCDMTQYIKNNKNTIIKSSDKSSSSSKEEVRVRFNSMYIFYKSVVRCL